MNMGDVINPIFWQFEAPLWANEVTGARNRKNHASNSIVVLPKCTWHRLLTSSQRACEMMWKLSAHELFPIMLQTFFFIFSQLRLWIRPLSALDLAIAAKHSFMRGVIPSSKVFSNNTSSSSSSSAVHRVRTHFSYNRKSPRGLGAMHIASKDHSNLPKVTIWSQF